MVTPEQLEAVLDEAELDWEALTVVLVAGATRDQVLTTLGASPEPAALGDVDWDHASAYAVVEIAGGVLALEHSGYADPSLDVLARLSSFGGSAAVARSNIKAQDRFGCAADGEVVFDAAEYPFVEVEEKQPLPSRLRPLFDTAWVDLDAPDDVEPEADPTLVAITMACDVTGLEPTVADLERAREATYHQVPVLTYLG
ncbi:DUF6461 domain-containing protein [Nocardioides lentus]